MWLMWCKFCTNKFPITSPENTQWGEAISFINVMGKAIWMGSVWFNVLFLARAQAYNAAQHR